MRVKLKVHFSAQVIIEYESKVKVEIEGSTLGMNLYIELDISTTTHYQAPSRKLPVKVKAICMRLCVA